MATPLRIIHIFRAPVGGLFRHVRDLARGQSAMGHQVGIICDAGSGGDAARSSLAEAEQWCRLGVHRVAMSRIPGPGDIKAAGETARLARTWTADILHGHGAKGGLYARLAGRRLKARSFYTPHGGSLHYAWRSPAGFAFLAAEKALHGFGTGLLFVCAYERRIFDEKIGLGTVANRVVYNGLWPEDFAPAKPDADASDLLFIGELRALKGVSDLLAAISLVRATQPVTATIVGDGPERALFQAEASRLGVAGAVRFAGAMPARQAFPLGRIFVMPSRAESFPYVVLEAAAAGLPVVATAVGGIPEILPAGDLVPPHDPKALAAAIRSRFAGHGSTASAVRETIRSRFGAERMVTDVTEFYTQAGR